MIDFKGSQLEREILLWGCSGMWSIPSRIDNSKR